MKAGSLLKTVMTPFHCLRGVFGSFNVVINSFNGTAEEGLPRILSMDYILNAVDSEIELSESEREQRSERRNEIQSYTRQLEEIIAFAKREDGGGMLHISSEQVEDALWLVCNRLSKEGIVFCWVESKSHAEHVVNLASTPTRIVSKAYFRFEFADLCKNGRLILIFMESPPFHGIETVYLGRAGDEVMPNELLDITPEFYENIG